MKKREKREGRERDEEGEREREREGGKRAKKPVLHIYIFQVYV